MNITNFKDGSFEAVDDTKAKDVEMQVSICSGLWD